MSAITPFLGKKYKLKSSENLEEYMKFIGIGMIFRKMAMSLSSVISLAGNEDGSYTMTSSSTVNTSQTTFKLGEEFSEARGDGAKMKSTMTIDGNKLIQIQVEDNGKKSTHVREFTPDQLISTTTAEGWDGKCVRLYELQK